jgi:hypothetical protein
MAHDRRSFLGNVFGMAAAVSATPGEGQSIKGPTGDIFEKVDPVPGSEVLPHPMTKPSAASYLDIQDGYLYMGGRFEDGKFRSVNLNRRDWQDRCDLAAESLGYGSRTYLDTNLLRANAMPAPECFLIQSVGMVFDPTSNPDDRELMVARTLIEIRLGQKIYFRRPLADCFTVSELSTTIASHQKPISGFAALDVPLLLQTQQQFSFNLFFHQRLGAELIRGPVDFWGVFRGRHARGVQ